MAGGGVGGGWRFGAEFLFDGERRTGRSACATAECDAGLGAESGGEVGTRFGEGFGAGVGRRARTSAHSGLLFAKLRKTWGSCDQGPKRSSKVR